MSKKKIILIVLVILVISFSVRFFTSDVSLQSYRIPVDHGSNYFTLDNAIIEKHPKLNEVLIKADNAWAQITENPNFNPEVAAQHPPSVSLTNSEARELLSTFGNSEYETNIFFMFKKFYLNQDNKYYDSGIMICFFTCGSND
ncbi:MAG: hypothetical protein ACE5DL_01660 [Nitrosopumilaceae archaeon]